MTINHVVFGIVRWYYKNQLNRKRFFRRAKLAFRKQLVLHTVIPDDFVCLLCEYVILTDDAQSIRFVSVTYAFLCILLLSSPSIEFVCVLYPTRGCVKFRIIRKQLKH